MSLTVDQMKEITRRFVIEPWAHGNIAVFDEVCAPNYTVGQDGNIQTQKDAVTKFRAAIPDLNIEIHEMIAEGDWLAYRWTMKGTFEKMLYGVPPTGKEVSSTGITILRFENGKIAEDKYESTVNGFEPQSA